MEADICIVGAGAAGISIATELLATECSVILLEGGGLRFEHQHQAMHRARVTGRDYIQPEVTRRRQFGGTTAVWSGKCRILDPIDFEDRPWVAHGGWPISAEDLEPYWARAHTLCGLGPYDYSVDNRLFAGTDLQAKLFYFSHPVHFGRKYGGALRDADNVRVILHANAVEVLLHPDGRSVRQIQCATVLGQRFAVTARYYVLAGGGLEVPRLLLNSRSVQPAGVGNAHDLVGRFFADHVDTFAAVVDKFPPGFPREFTRLNYEYQQLDLRPTYAIGLSEAAMRRDRMLNAAAFLVWRPLHKTYDAFYSHALRGALELVDVLKHRKPPSRMVIHSVRETLVHADKVLGVMARAIRGRFGGRGAYVLNIQAEAVPNPESRVTLDDARDSLGLQRLALRWQLTAQDLESYRRFEAALVHGLRACGLQVRPLRLDLDAEGWPVSLVPSRHHTGTTRMHGDPTRGVVDADCRVHGIGNLFIASSAVFPTVGMANPTVTIVALAVRLAAHLKRLLAQPAASL